MSFPSSLKASNIGENIRLNNSMGARVWVPKSLEEEKKEGLSGGGTLQTWSLLGIFFLMLK